MSHAREKYLGKDAVFELYRNFARSQAIEAPSFDESIEHILGQTKPRVHDLLREADRTGRVLVQPRCGVGAPAEMADLLRYLENTAAPDILSLTIDSHTRLLRFEALEAVIHTNPAKLNGFPLVSWGWQIGRDLNACVSAPIEVRHGSPDGRLLFGATIASGLTSFEGGGIGYNIPYCKKIPLEASLSAWQEIDAFSGELAERGIFVDREFFGTLTGVLMPPSISLAIGLLEAFLAAREGVRCLSIAYGQSGQPMQDVAALRTIRKLGQEWMPKGSEVHSVLHQFMGAFPARQENADALIALGSLTARLGCASKMISKTNEEALGIPRQSANAAGIQLSRLFNAPGFAGIVLNQDILDEEQGWLEREVRELIEPILAATDPIAEICRRFADGRLDVPFSASLAARADVLPARDTSGAIRIQRFGNLEFSQEVKQRHQMLLSERSTSQTAAERFQRLRDDILYFAHQPPLGATRSVLQ